MAAFDQLSFLCSISLSRTATFTSLHLVTILFYPLQMPRSTPKYERRRPWGCVIRKVRPWGRTVRMSLKL